MINFVQELCYHPDDMIKEKKDLDDLISQKRSQKIGEGFDKFLLTFNQLDIKSGTFKRTSKTLDVIEDFIQFAELS